MICTRCHRPLKAAFMQIKGMALGPKCAEKMGLVEKNYKKSTKRQVVVRLTNKNTPHQDGQLDIFQQGEDFGI